MSLIEEIDYSTFPEEEFPKQHERLESIRRQYERRGIVSGNDMEYVLAKANHFYILLHHMADRRVELLSQILNLELEINSLSAVIRQQEEEGQ